MIRMSETTRTHTPGKQLDCDIFIISLMKHVLTNRPMFHSDSEKLRSKILATKSSSSDQTWHIEKKKEVWYGLWYDIHLSLALFRYPCYWIHSIDISGRRNGRDSYVFLLTCVIGSYDRLIGKDIFISYVGLF